MKLTKLITALALATAVIMAAPIIAMATHCSVSVAPSVVDFVVDTAYQAKSAAYDASFRIQEAVLANTSATKGKTSEAIVDHSPLSKRMLQVGGKNLPYVECYKADSAPERGAGLWRGTDSTTDGEFGYFIGHNPGDFAPVLSLEEGDVVTVCDSNGLQKTYTVVDFFNVEEETYWHDIEERVSGYGESVVLQACCGDNAHYRVVVAVA